MKRILNAFSLLIFIEALIFALCYHFDMLDHTSLLAGLMVGTAISCLIALEEKSLIKKTLRQQGPKK